MKLTFVQLRTYVAAAAGLGLTDDDQIDLETVLLANPNAGGVMQGTGGLRKLRHAPRSRSGGKSGGIRVCYAHFPAHSHVYFVTAFAKNRQGNLTAAEKNAIRTLLRDL